MEDSKHGLAEVVVIFFRSENGPQYPYLSAPRIKDSESQSKIPDFAEVEKPALHAPVITSRPWVLAGG